MTATQATAFHAADLPNVDDDRSNRDQCGHLHSHRGARPAWLTQRLARLIIFYQRAREGKPSPCRFFPSCSAYALEAVELHGSWRGGWLSMRRLLRCRPFGPSGFDPVPEYRSPMSSHSPSTTHVQKGG